MLKLLVEAKLFRVLFASAQRDYLAFQKTTSFCALRQYKYFCPQHSKMKTSIYLYKVGCCTNIRRSPSPEFKHIFFVGVLYIYCSEVRSPISSVTIDILQQSQFQTQFPLHLFTNLLLTKDFLGQEVGTKAKLSLALGVNQLK